MIAAKTGRLLTFASRLGLQVPLNRRLQAGGLLSLAEVADERRPANWKNVNSMRARELIASMQKRGASRKDVSDDDSGDPTAGGKGYTSRLSAMRWTWKALSDQRVSQLRSTGP